MLVFQDKSLVPIGYTDSDFQSDRESKKSTSRYVFTLGGGAINWRSVKQSSIADSTMDPPRILTHKTQSSLSPLNKLDCTPSIPRFEIELLMSHAL